MYIDKLGELFELMLVTIFIYNYYYFFFLVLNSIAKKKKIIMIAIANIGYILGL